MSSSSAIPPTLHDEDSEDDEDYVPPDNDDNDSSSDDERDAKRPRTASPQLTEEDEAAKKLQREALWASFQASVTNPVVERSEAPPVTMVKVEKRYRFAGEEVVEVVEVPGDSPEAKKWPIWQPFEDTTVVSTPPPTHLDASITASVPISTASSSTEAIPPKLTGKRPGPRKSKLSLSSLPNPTSQTEAKRISTLEKSAMDWRAHIQGSGLNDELEANRRGGGYLEKVDFLQRVEERKEATIEASKSSKRRRP